LKCEGMLLHKFEHFAYIVIAFNHHRQITIYVLAKIDLIGTFNDLNHVE
jgi:hypothetical protein